MVLKKVMKQLFSPSVRPDRNTVKKKQKKPQRWRRRSAGEMRRRERLRGRGVDIMEMRARGDDGGEKGEVK